MRAIVCTMFILCLCCVFMLQGGARAAAEEKYRGEQGHVTFNASVDVPPDVSELRLIKMHCKLGFEPKQWIAVMQSYDPTISVSERESFDGTIYGLLGRWGEGFVNGTTGIASYKTQRGREVSNVILFADAGEDDPVFYGSDLPFMTAEEAAMFSMGFLPARKTDSADGAHIEVDQVFPLNADILNRLNEYAAKNMDEFEEMGATIARRERWTEEDACYYIRFRETVGGVKAHPEEFFPINTQGVGISPFSGEIILSADGVEYISFYDIAEVVSVTECASAMSLEAACGNYAAYHGQLLGEDPITVIHISFAYVPMAADNRLFYEEIEYRPAYVFYRDDKMLSETFDAVTGEVLSWTE